MRWLVLALLVPCQAAGPPVPAGSPASTEAGVPQPAARQTAGGNRAPSASPPALVCEIDLNILRGELRRLSWAPNGVSLHVQTLDARDVYDYIVDLGNGEISQAFGEPVWAAAYWARKSSLTAPGVPSLRLEVTENNRRTRPTPFTGGFANGGGQTPDPRNPVDAYEHEVTLRYLGVEIGNWINGAPMAGDTFSWGEEGTGALVYTDTAGRVTFIDPERRKVTVASTREAVLPAWSGDGRRLAFFQKAGRRTYRLMVSSIQFR